MKLFPEDPNFSIGEVGFDGKDANGRPYDVLGRKPLGQKLTDLVERIDQPLVIALDGGWGSGKSHFLKLWAGAHKLELGGTAEVIYFDAFEHDFLDDPLVSLVSRLTSEKAAGSFVKTALTKLKKAAYPLARLTLRATAAIATAGATEVAGAVGDVAIQTLGNAAEQSIAQFWKIEAGRIAAMQAFRDALEDLTKPIKATDPPRKIVFIVDELDRCRPDYALTLLEIIKHFFAVPNVHFVLGANLVALENSVKARYGAEINATEYLTKFVQLRMTFPKAQDQQGNDAWAAYFDATSAEMKLNGSGLQSLRANLRTFSRGSEISLRDTQRLLSRIALFPNTFWTFTSSYSRLATSAVILLVLAPANYARLRQGTLTIQDIENLFPLDPNDQNQYQDAQILNHLWRRVLLEDPGQETLQITKNAFDYFTDHLGKDHFTRLWADIFDTFHLPTPP